MEIKELNRTSPARIADTGTAAALGNFDGVHLGHRAVIGRALKRAHELNIPSAVWTLKSGGTRSGMITDDLEKGELIASLGADLLCISDFDKIRSMSCESFVRDILYGELNCRYVCCGYNFTFGAGRSGSSETLACLCEGFGIECETVGEIRRGNAEISSTAVRELLTKTDFAEAEKLCGHRYFRIGRVEHGKGVGKTLNYPTVNTLWEENRVPLPHGVYKTSLIVLGGESDICYPAISNLGIRPTFDDGNTVNLETHALADTGDIYGRTVKIEFERFIRSERKFSSPDELTAQIALDIKEAYGVTT